MRCLRLALFLSSLLLNAQQLVFKPYHENGIYALGEKVGWTVTPAGRFKYIIKKNGLDTIRTGELDAASVIETTLNEPAMVLVEVATDPPVQLGAAVAPAEMQPSVARPADFDAFWDAKLKALSEVPMNPALTRTETAKPGVELYTVKLDSLGSHVRGYLAKPAREGKFPALVIYQWAGVYALQPASAVDRAAEGWLTFNVSSHDMPLEQSGGVSKNYQAIGNADRETSYFLAMYLRDARAIDYIASRPDWDGKTLVIIGTSMGGQQSLVTAGLRSNITAVIVNEPAGADSNGALHGRKSGYPNWPPEDARVMETALYFDTVNFAPRIKAPVLAAIGFIDRICPPAGIWIAVNQIPGPKEVIPMVESDHNNLTPDKQGAYTARSKEVLDTLLKGEPFTIHPATAETPRRAPD